ncbi:hypothetical protein TIFTF001_020913 [Ficus carica]|uniref:ARM repeat superfamily protein n=1 Tax=Ficus carica TaxID=3494 RepID=A0AA88DBE0_FICCA|nr:hypothetical protein TIFTF001_020913 [Ficus carica]
MASSFPDPSKAEECFQKLNDMKDNNIFNMLELLVNDLQHINAHSTRDKLLNIIGEKHQNFKFLQMLSLKCSYNVFNSEHVHCILDNLSGSNFGNKQFKDSSVKLLLVITRIFPMLLRGSEEQFQFLLERSNTIDDKMIEVLAKAGPHISLKISEIYPFLKRVCLEGTRLQSKFAVLAIAALVDTSKQFIFSDLCKELVESLHCGKNIPTVLQSLGCLAQHSASTFEAQDQKITPFIYETILQVDLLDDSNPFDDISGHSDSFNLKVSIDAYLLIVVIGCSQSNNACVRLAAAKAVLRLSRRWDLHICPETFYFTISLTKDELPFARRSFLDKTHKLLKERAIPSRYACSYALASSDCLKDIQDDSSKYMTEFVKEYSREARIRQTARVQQGLITDFPAYVVVFLIHLLAHDKEFPLEECQNETLCARFCSPLFCILQALLDASNVDGDLDVVKDAVLYLLCVFRAIKRAEDAVDVEKTPKLHLLADIGFFFVTAVNQSGIPTSHTPGHILLPSSLYRANSICPTQSCLDERFAKKVVHIFKSHNTSELASNLSKCGRKYLEDSMQSDGIKESKLNLAPRKIGDLPIVKTAEPQKTGEKEIIVRSRGKRAASPNAPVSVQLHECSKIDRHAVASEKSGLSLEKGQLLSSSGSVPVKPSLAESHVSTRNSKRNSASLKEIVEVVNSSSSAEYSKVDKTNLKAACSLKETSSKGEALTGSRIKLLSPIDKGFRSGTVDGFNSENNTHKIACDSGVVEQVCLDSESWETLNDDSQLKRVTLAEHSNVIDLQHRGRKKTVDKVGEDVAEKSKHVANKENEKKKRLKAYADASASEVINRSENAWKHFFVAFTAVDA